MKYQEKYQQFFNVLPHLRHLLFGTFLVTHAKNLQNVCSCLPCFTETGSGSDI